MFEFTFRRFFKLNFPFCNQWFDFSGEIFIYDEQINSHLLHSVQTMANTLLFPYYALEPLSKPLPSIFSIIAEIELDKDKSSCKMIFQYPVIEEGNKWAGS